MIRYYLPIFLWTFVFSQHFNVDIANTGESTLFIFSENINNLSDNDEIAIFDEICYLGKIFYFS